MSASVPPSIFMSAVAMVVFAVIIASNWTCSAEISSIRFACSASSCFSVSSLISAIPLVVGCASNYSIAQGAVANHFKEVTHG